MSRYRSPTEDDIYQAFLTNTPPPRRDEFRFRYDCLHGRPIPGYVAEIEATTSPEVRDALVALYHATNGPGWKNSDNWLSEAPLDQWHGVFTDCDGTLISLALTDNQLSGEIPAELGNLSNLRGLFLDSNQLSGEIPAELWSLSNLRRLDLDGNQLTGEMPPELGSLPYLVQLNLSSNRLVGEIPSELGSLSNLETLHLDNNRLVGEIPPEFGSLPSLELLFLSRNHLTGEIPPELGSLPNLIHLDLGNNQLRGEIPPELGDLSQLLVLVLHGNHLTGPIPPELGRLSNLGGLSIEGNRFTGPIPPELGSLSNLRTLHLAGNQLSGEIPPELGSLSNLKWLFLYTNHLTGEIPPELGSLPYLEQLDLSSNQLVGEIPPELGELGDTLTILRLSGNDFTGCLPAGLADVEYNDFGRLGLETCSPSPTSTPTAAATPTPTPTPTPTAISTPTPTAAPASIEVRSLERDALIALYDAAGGANWTNSDNWLSDRPVSEWRGVTLDPSGRVVELRLRDNQLSGPMPPELSSLANLRSLDLKDNQLTGEIPAWLGGLTNLEMLDLSWNRLSGEIPAELGNLGKLERLFLGANGIGGGIPSEFGNLTHLRELWLGDGLGLTGELPPELSRLTRLEVIDLGHSDVSGPLPAWMGDMTRLRLLYLDGNQFAGEVPAELGSLSRLELLTLHGNSALLGALPQALTKITRLGSLTFHDTGLCAPLDDSFQAWLRKVPDRQGPNCFSGSGRVIVRDVFGREVNETGIVLVDWEGHIANPLMKYSAELPGATAILSSTEPRLYFDLPSLAGANGPTKGLSSEDPAKATEFRISIFPDRDTSDESHTLTIRYVGGGGRVISQTIDVHVIDQDVDRPLEFNVISDYSYDDTGMFDDPAAREAVQQAADDWAYFIADMNLDEVRAGEEQMWIWYPEEQRRQGFGEGVSVTNDVAYTGFLMHVYGYPNEKIRASGGPSWGGRNQSSGVVEFPIKRSGSITFDPRGNWNTLGWRTSADEDTWWEPTNYGDYPSDLYSIALHEMGHAVVFNDGHDGFAGFYEAREVRDPAVLAYYGSYPVMNKNHHILGIDPVSGRGVYGDENNGITPDGRWIVTKLDLLIAQATGYVLRDTSPFRDLSLPDEPLAEGSVGTLYAHTMNVVGGIPAYYWTIDSGALPDGLTLESFTGAISGTPQESGTFEFTIRVRDNTEGDSGVVRAVTLNVKSRASDQSG